VGMDTTRRHFEKISYYLESMEPLHIPNEVFVLLRELLAFSNICINYEVFSL